MHPVIRLLEQSFAIEGGGIPADMSAQGVVGARTWYYGRSANVLLAHGHLPAHQDYGLFTGQEHGVQATPGR